MQLLGTEPVEKEDLIRFDSFGWSFLALYKTFSGEDWTDVLYTAARLQEKNGLFSVIFSVIFIILFYSISYFIILNLFVAVLVENLSIDDDEKKNWRRSIEPFQLSLLICL